MKKRGQGAAAKGRGRKQTQEPAPQTEAPQGAAETQAQPSPPRNPINELTDKLAAERTSNITDETIRDFIKRGRVARNELEAAKKEQRSANGRLRVVFKEAKKAGIEPKDLGWLLDEEEGIKADPEAFRREQQRRNRLMRLAKLPVGYQLGLFEDGTTVGAAVDNDQLAEEEANGKDDDDATAYHKGHDLGMAGKQLVSPYTLGTRQAEQHAKGWQDAQAERVREMGGAPPGATVQ